MWPGRRPWSRRSPAAQRRRPRRRTRSTRTATAQLSTCSTRTFANDSPASVGHSNNSGRGRSPRPSTWYRQHDRLVTTPTRDGAITAAVDAWEADLRANRRTVLLAWRRRDVAALNERARQRCVEAGRVVGPELRVPGGKCFASGDRVVTLAPASDGRFVTSEQGTVIRVGSDALTVRFDDDRDVVLSGEDLAPDRLDHAYAVTVHRMQGATVDRSHVLADGGGRELAYVAMSRAREASQVYVVAENIEEAVDDLAREWATDRRQRWTLDVDKPAAAGEPVRPNLSNRTTHAVRMARLRAERDAVSSVDPDATRRLEALDLSLRLCALEARGREHRRGLGLTR